MSNPQPPTVGYPTPFIQLSNALQSETTWKSGLEGRMLTFVDATFSDKEQREAVKSIIKGIVRDYYQEMNQRIDYLINVFTDTFEGNKIEYTLFDSPYGHHDAKKDRDAGIFCSDIFHKE